MKRSLLLACAGLIFAGAAAAQNPPAQSGPNNNAVNSPGFAEPCNATRIRCREQRRGPTGSVR